MCLCELIFFFRVPALLPSDDTFCCSFIHIFLIGAGDQDVFEDHDHGDQNEAGQQELDNEGTVKLRIIRGTTRSLLMVGGGGIAILKLS